MNSPEPNPLPEADELRHLFPQFELEQRIGVGGMGVVYRAIQISVERPVALKVLSPHLAEDADFRDRFASEAKAMAKLRHPGLVQVHDFGTAGENLLWMAQEWIEGETLFDLFEREGALDADECAGLAMQVCQALGYAHGEGIIHRDIKPANLMVTPDGHVRVMDFGLARATRGGPANLAGRSRVRLGTPEYAAPELFDEGVEIDHRADVFALGVLLYQSLTGSLPQGEFRPPSELNPAIDPRYDVIVIRSMQRDPANRYLSCLDFEQALRTVVENPAQAGAVASAPLPARRLITGTSDSTKQLASISAPSGPAAPAGEAESPAPASKKPRGKLRPMIWATAAVLALGGAGWGIVAMRGDDKGPSAPVSATPTKPKPKSPDPPAPSPKPPPAKPKPADPGKAIVSTPDPPDPPDPPSPDPVPTAPEPADDDGQAGRSALAELDQKLNSAAEPLLIEFTAKRGELLATYASETAKAEQAAIAAGRLDELLFWDRELRFLVEKGVLPVDNGPVPEQAKALRNGWRKHINPLRDRIEELRVRHVRDCRGQAEVFHQGSKPVSASLLRKRAEGIDSIAPFLILCGWQPEKAPRDRPSEISGTLAELDSDLRAGRLSRLPSGTLQFGNSHYLLVKKPLDWESAKLWCEERGGHLATLARDDELEWFRNQTREDEKTNAWLGGEVKNGSWQWVSDETWTDKGWCPGEPKLEGSRQVLIWWGKRHGLDDIPFEQPSPQSMPFWIEWEGVQPPRGPLAAAGEQFPADIQPLHEVIRCRLAQCDPKEAKPLIRAYGSRLVATRRQLAAAGKSGAAAAIREVEEQLLELLGKGKPASPGKAPAAVDASELVVVARGEPSQHCLWERRDWKRRGGSMESVERVHLGAKGILGAGDFEIKARIKLPKIDNTRTQIAVGGTFVDLDVSPGEISLKMAGFSGAELKGARLGSFTKANEWFDVSVKRNGKILSVEINGRPALSATVGDGPAGMPELRFPVAGSGVESFSARGRWEPEPPEVILVVGRHEEGEQRAFSKGMSQLLAGKGDKLINLFTAKGFQPQYALWSARSTNGGAKWAQIEMLSDDGAGVDPVGSFAAASDPERDEVMVLHTAGKSNQRVWCRRSINGGGNWKDPVDLTDQVKQGGWNVNFHGQGLRLGRKSPKPGRIVLPVSFSRGETEAGHAGRDAYILLSDDGEAWRYIGPVLPQGGRQCEILEDHQGTLWLSGARSPQPNHGEMLGFRIRSSSKDGGETWSDPDEASWPDEWFRSSCIAAKDSRGKTCWYRCGIAERPRKAPPLRSHLAIFRSYDRGASWHLLRHFHYGTCGDSTILSRESESLILSFRRDHWDTTYDSIGFTELPLRWLEETDHSLR